MCALAKRMNFFRMPSPPDFFVLEFAVNDYQGQDHVLQVDHREDVFFEGFERIAACAESVVHRLLTDYPDAAVLFLEFQTAVLSRRTAQFLHMGVAQHYKIPVVSYADMMAPDFYRLLETLQPYNFALPTNKSFDIDSILPYPHGCAPCKPLDMTEQFRPDGCVSLCSFALEAGMTTSCPWEKTIFSSYKPCYVPFFAHDDVHPSATGHRMARDLVAHLIAHTALLMCRDRNQTYTDHGVPSHTGWLVSGSNYQQVLRARSDFVLVKDTMSIFAEPNPLMASFHTPGFELKLDNLFRRGWIAENATGGERVTFDIDLPIGECYVITLSVLNSYATMGSFNVTVEDTTKNTTTASQTVDCLWKPRISVPADVQVTSDERAECTGRCKVTITTNPEIADGRKGNLVKILTLAVRKCFLPPTV